MRICLLALALLLVAPGAALADTITVSGGKIQPSVDAAKAGDTVKIPAGTYAEDVSVPSGKDGLTLAADPGALISGTGGASNLSIASNNVKVSDLTIIKATGTDPALNATGGKLGLTGTAVLATGGDAIAVTGADNVIQRATVFTSAAADGADGIALGVGGLQVDSSIVVGGAKGFGFRVTTAQGSAASTLTLNHVTSSGVGGIALEAPDAGVTQLQKSGDITLSVNASIIHGTSTAFEADGQPNPIPALPAIAAPSVVKATYTNSDATQMAKAANSPGDPEIAGGGNPTADSALFRSGAALRLKASAPVIDKGGAAATGEADKDIDGDARTNGAATDIGADEFTNHPPTLELTLSGSTAKTGQVVSATGKATDPEGAEDVKGYAIDWGDGKKDTTASNVIQHVYDKSGTYTVTMLAADQSFATSAAATKTITVTDGQAPQIQVTTPKAGASVKLGKGKKAKSYLIKGVDADESGLTSIELAITKKGSKCQQYNGKKLVKGSCTAYKFVKAKLSGNGFSLKIAKGKLAKGSYEIRARGTDTKGNATSGFDKTLKTLVSFKVR